MKYMKKLDEYRKVAHLLKEINVEKAYPLSIVEGYQRGEIYVDNADHPMCALFWHYCGFAFIAGSYTEHIDEICEMMNNLPSDNSNRLVLQSKNDIAELEVNNMIRRERYCFTFVGPIGEICIPDGCKVCPISSDNYDLIHGRIIPAFSWKDKEDFLKNGFGFCLMKGNEVLSSAFSAAISNEYVDIGIETNEKYRGNGYGKTVAAAMAEQILYQEKKPTWACDIQNEGSMRLACKVGFRVDGVHPWYKIRYRL